LGQEAVLTAKGRMKFKTDKVKHVEEMIDKAHALQSKDHPGCTHGYGNRPWKHALKSNHR
jgi:hypothetical protein